MAEDRNVYVKEGGRYKPIGYWFTGHNDWLSEGVWVVTKHEHSKGMTNGQYLKDIYGIDKVSDLTEVSFAEIGGLNKIVDEIVMNYKWEDFHNKSMYEIVSKIAGDLFLASKRKEKKDE